MLPLNGDSTMQQDLIDTYAESHITSFTRFFYPDFQRQPGNATSISLITMYFVTPAMCSVLV